jgi:hypothetical protein
MPLAIDEKTGILTFNIFAGTKPTDIFDIEGSKEKNTGIMKANFKAILSTGLVKPITVLDPATKKTSNRIGYPEFISISSREGRQVYKLTKVVKPKKDKTLTTTSPYEFGSQATYVPVAIIGTKEVLPYAIDLDEHALYIVRAQMAIKSKKEKKSDIEVEVEANYYTSELLRANPDKLFLFGDNNTRTGKGGQAIIRDELNAMGISTKKLPKNTPDAFMSDTELASNKAIINDDIYKAKQKAAKEGKTIVLPKEGLGTGLAALATKAPQTFAYLNKRLQEEFGFDNNNGTINAQEKEADENAPDFFEETSQKPSAKKQKTSDSKSSSLGAMLGTKKAKEKSEEEIKEAEKKKKQVEQEFKKKFGSSSLFNDDDAEANSLC